MSTKVESDSALTLFAQIKRHLTWQRLTLGTILLISAFLEFFQLNQEGYANTYYAAGVKSMLTSWHNFFFVSFDAGGFVSLDKPPLGFWIQAISAKIFGFSGFSLLLPEALAGVLAVALLYYLVARAFGNIAGLFAALVLALTPITVVTDRNNTIDSLLVLTLLCAAWAVSYASETGKPRWLLLGAVAVGLGFNIKMLQAYLVVPAFMLMYLCGAPIRWRTRIWHLLLAGIVLIVVSLSWAIIVDLTPASARPYVSDSGTNSELSLILGYNGLGRVSSSLISQIGALRFLSSAIDLNIAPAFAPNIGDPGLLRLFNQGLSGQVSWLLPLAIIGLIVVLARRQARPWFPLTQRGQAILLWGGWLLTTGIYFSTSQFFHFYYLVMLAPPIAAMAGIGIAVMWEDYRRPGGRSWLLPIALLLATTVQIIILQNYSEQSIWLIPLLIIGGAIATIVCIFGKLSPNTFDSPQVVPGAIIAALIVLLMAPAVWDIVSLQNNNGSAWLPQAGPATSRTQGFNGEQFGQGGGNTHFGGGTGGFGGGNGNGNTGFGGGNNNTRLGKGGFGGRTGFESGSRSFGGGSQGAITYAGTDWNVLDSKLVSYLETNQGKTRFLVATETSSYASIFILATNRPAMALGGYQGWDGIVTPTQLAKLVDQGVVRFFYISANSGQSSNTAGSSTSTTGTSTINSNVFKWITSSCTAVSSTLWQSTTSTSNTSGFGGNGGRSSSNLLYDCAGHR